MGRLITDYKEQKEKRNLQIIQAYLEMVESGGQKMKIYELLSERFNISVGRVRVIIDKYNN